MPLSNDDLVKILEAKFLVSPGRAVSLSQALGAVYFYGDRINDLIGALEGKVDGLPSKVWTHPLPRTVGKGVVSTGDLLRFESAEHANTRTLVEKLAAIPDGVDLSRIEKAVQDALAAGVNVHVTTGGKS